MITKIQFQNIESFENASISFEKGKYAFKNSMIDGDIVNPIAIYGKNGTGKTCVIRAIRNFLSMMIDDPSRIHPFTPNLFLKDRESSKLVISFTLDGSEFEYSIETRFTSKDSLVSERLTRGGGLIFERRKKDLVIDGNRSVLDFDLFPALRNLSIQNPNNSSPSFALVKKVYDYFSSFAVITEASYECLCKKTISTSPLDVAMEKNREVNEIYSRYSDFPNMDIAKVSDAKKGVSGYYAVIHGKKGRYSLPYSLVSEGMVSSYVLFSILSSLPDGSPLIVDEIERGLHPLVIQNLFEEVQKKHIQLIFTSHDTNILQLLRPDQIFFTYWDEGVSSIQKLSDIYPNIREVNNIEKMYLGGTFNEFLASSHD